MVTAKEAAHMIAEEVTSARSQKILRLDLNAAIEFAAEALLLDNKLTEQQMLKGLIELERHVLPKCLKSIKDHLAEYVATPAE